MQAPWLVGHRPPAEGRLLLQVVGPDPGCQGAQGEGTGSTARPGAHGAGGHGEPEGAAQELLATRLLLPTG